jgi:hypothetical protein
VEGGVDVGQAGEEDGRGGIGRVPGGVRGLEDEEVDKSSGNRATGGALRQDETNLEIHERFLHLAFLGHEPLLLDIRRSSKLSHASREGKRVGSVTRLVKLRNHPRPVCRARGQRTF